MVAELSNVRFAYPKQTSSVFEDVHWSIDDGELVLVIGESGSGKSTLLRVLNGLVPHFTGGRFGGEVVVAGNNTRSIVPRQLSSSVGFVYQDPEAQMLTSRVDDEICFGMEQMGIPRPEMRRRLEDTLDVLGIQHLRHRKPQELSGGEQQRVAIATALVLRPRLLVLDEPTSQLDSIGADLVIDAITRLHDDLGLSIVVSEHRLDRLFARVDRVRAVDRGLDCTPRDAVAQLPIEQIPTLARLARSLHWHTPPLSLGEARKLPELAELRQRLGSAPEAPPRTSTTVVSADRITASQGGQVVLQDLSLDLGGGEIVAVVGRNGSGKTTLLRALLGFQKLDAGRIHRDADTSIGYLPQRASSLFFHDTIGEEIGWSLQMRSSFESISSVLDRFNLTGKDHTHPLDLSGGEREMAALAVALAGDPEVAVLDEPTRGMDTRRKAQLIQILQDRAARDLVTVFATHDVELVASVATRVIVLGEHEVISDGHPRSVLPQSLSLSPQVNRLLGETWLTVQDVLDRIT